jgi:hypothetical protein
MGLVAALTPGEKAEVLREAFNKHAKELLAIEDAQQKLTTVLLAILGAGASFVAGTKPPLSTGARLGLSLVVVATVLIGIVYTKRRNNARLATRQLLVRCEEALGFHESDQYTAGPLYSAELKDFPLKGSWLGLINWLVIAAGAGFLLLVWLIQ